ncbi:MAG: peptidoglycan -binding protein [Alphaproteobacteria bacterium]|nr:peptidoglycan -binding protein [Alphaproteobacteria bacterium]
MAVRTRGRSGQEMIWPGFVDGLSSLIIAIMFVLLAFVLSQQFLTQTLTTRDEALRTLNSQIAELTEVLALERRTNAEMRINLAQLTATLQTVTRERDDLVLQMSDANALTERLAGRINELTETAIADKETIKIQLAEAERLQRDIEALRKVREDLEGQVGRLSSEAGALRDRSRELESRLASERERTALAQRDLQARETRLAELQALYLSRQSEVDGEKRLSAAAQAQVAALNQQLQALRQQLAAIQGALQAAEGKDKDQQVVIADLGRRLNQALAQRVEELSRYRSEFFGRLREVLGDRRDIVIVGDRFVFQAEVLFPSGSAQLGEEGRTQLLKLAGAIREISPRIPQGIDWILRVDGHTDAVPISTAQFPSNWELSAARAISVVQFLVANGVSPRRVAATGFGEFQPIDSGRDEIALRRNRRIEFKLTER